LLLCCLFAISFPTIHVQYKKEIKKV
jgi:hypothetical protein